MANRFPLVLDTTDNNKIKEIQTGDNLYLADNSITGVQNITALGTIDAAQIRVAGQLLVAQQFADLTDTPSTFTGSESQFVKVNAAGTGLEFASLGSLGTIQLNTISVDASIIPTVNNVGTIGSDNFKFNDVVSTTLRGNLAAYDGTIVFNATTGKISYAALQGSPTFLSEFTDDIGFVTTASLGTQIAGLYDDGITFNTDIQGSVFADDSSMIIDGVAGKVLGDVINSSVTTTDLITTTAQVTTTTATTINGPAAGNLAIDAGASGIVNIGFGAATNVVNIGDAVIESFTQGRDLGVANLTANTNLTITAGNRVKIDGGVPFRFSSTTTANQLAIGAEEGDVIYNTTTSRLQMYQGSAWKDVNGNVEATAGTSNFNNIIVAGDLTVQGTTTTVDSTNTDIKDNVIVLNYGEAGAGVTLGTSGIEIDRGTESNKTFVWNEATDKWTLGAETLVAATVEAAFTGILGGVTPAAITGTVVTAGTGFIGNLTGFTYGQHIGTLDGDMTGSVFGDDSTVLVDGVNSKIVGNIETASIRTSEDRIALGDGAGATNQAYGGIAIGNLTGTVDQGSQAVAVGVSAGRERQGSQATALGRYAGQNDQGVSAVAVGASAARESQGAEAIAIGKLAGETNQAANSIVLNATGSAVENTTASSTVIQPVRSAASPNIMMYNPANGELTHTATPGTLAANIDLLTLQIGATTATVIGIGNASSTTTINGTLSSPALISGNITADDSMSITTATGDGNAISIGPTGTNTAVNLTADSIRFFGAVTRSIDAVAGVVGDLKGSVVADDSTVMIDGVGGIVTGPVDTTTITGTTITASTTIKASTIANLTGTDDIAVNAAGFININAGTDDAGLSKIQMDQTGVNHIEITTEPKVPGNAADVANVAINATAASGDVIIGTTGSTRNQTVTMHNATVNGTLVGQVLGTIVGDVKGSVVADDSSVIIDGVAGKVVGPISKIVGDVQQISGAGVISLDTLITEITTTGTDAYTLADGVVGQVKIILAADVSGGTGTVTPTTVQGGTTLTFDAVGESITLIYTSVGWMRTAGAAGVLA